jgi:hypothetical protein
MVRKGNGNKGKVLVALFIGFLMVSSVIGFLYGQSDNSASNSQVRMYNGIDFIRTSQGWSFEKDGIYTMDNHPSDLEDVEYESFEISSNKVYLAYDPLEEIPALNVYQGKMAALLRHLGYLPVLGCIKEEGCGDFPIVDCGSEFTVFLYKNGESEKVSKMDSCVVIEGSEYGMNRASDKALYLILGVIR